VSEEGALWPALASRVIRVALVRADLSYSLLARSLASVGVVETERSLIARVSRGAIRLSLLLQIIHITDAAVPVLWHDALKMKGTWEMRAAAVVAAEMAAQPWVSHQRLIQRLSDIGTAITEQTLAPQLSKGTVSLSLFLQCLTVLRSPSLDGYVEARQLVRAAQNSVTAGQK
jgi:hypothetical protein